jgi:ribosomal-protein-alanine N-acetyltransferase
MIKIRKARDEDIIKVADLEKQCFSRPWSYQSFIYEGRIVGFAILHRFVDEGELFNIAVAEDVRRQKIGERLLRDIFVGAKKYGIKKIFLEVRKSNDPASFIHKVRL